MNIKTQPDDNDKISIIQNLLKTIKIREIESHSAFDQRLSQILLF